MEVTKELLLVIKTNPNGIFDFIANRGHEFTRTEMQRLAMELAYAHICKDPMEALYTNLEEHWGE